MLPLLLLALVPSAKPEVGQPAPAFTLPAANIQSVFPDKKDTKTISLSELAGKGGSNKNVVLFFYPKAMTRG